MSTDNTDRVEREFALQRARTVYETTGGKLFLAGDSMGKLSDTFEGEVPRFALELYFQEYLKTHTNMLLSGGNLTQEQYDAIEQNPHYHIQALLNAGVIRDTGKVAKLPADYEPYLEKIQTAQSVDHRPAYERLADPEAPERVQTLGRGGHVTTNEGTPTAKEVAPTVTRAASPFAQFGTGI